MAIYKAVTRLVLVYASSIWSPLTSSTSINKVKLMQKAALRTVRGCTQDTNIQHLRDSSEKILPRLTGHTIAQRRTNKSHFIKSYLYKVDAKSHPSPLFSVCNPHTSSLQHHPHTHHVVTPGFVDIPRGVTSLLSDGRRSWLVDLDRVKGVGRQQQQTKYTHLHI